MLVDSDDDDVHYAQASHDQSTDGDVTSSLSSLHCSSASEMMIAFTCSIICFSVMNA